MIKKILLYLLFIPTLALTVVAQKKTTSPTPQSNAAENKDNRYEHYKKIYEQAVKYNDFVVAKNALHGMIALQPERSGLKDTLAYIYFNGNNHLQVIILGKEILESQPDKSDILELVAVSQQNLGLQKEALESFEKLFAMTKDPYHQYSIASLQYMLKRFGECSESLNSILSSDDNSGVVTITDNRGETQQVPLKAAAFNMRGVIALEINQSDVAKQNFQKALELFPDFSLAKGNLDKMNEDSKKTTPAKKN